MTRRETAYDDSMILALLALDEIPRDFRDPRTRSNRRHGYVDLPAPIRR